MSHEIWADLMVRIKNLRGDMIGFLPPMAATIASLLYFADYARQEFEPVLDERMIVNTYVAIDPTATGTIVEMYTRIAT